ncbi:MAG: metallophosphoesterase family protein [Myxococcota bacterium]
MSEKLIAQITDIHYPVYKTFKFKDIFSKRITGFANLLFSSRRRFRPHLLPLSLQNLDRLGVKHIVITGDLVNLAYPSEYGRLKEVFEESPFTPSQFSIIPGNHDAYTKAAYANNNLHKNLGLFAGVDSFASYPLVRDLGDFTIIGLSTAIPTEFGMAYGKIDELQLQKLRVHLENSDKPQVIALHHPPQKGLDGWSDGLVNGSELRKLLSNSKVECILHGHEHLNSGQWLQGTDSSRIPVYGTSCAILDPKQSSKNATVRLLRFVDGHLEKTWLVKYNKKTGHWNPVEAI